MSINEQRKNAKDCTKLISKWQSTSLLITSNQLVNDS